MNKKEIASLINLLDDPDEVVFASVKEKLLLYGKEIIPTLETAWENHFRDDILFHERVEDLIHEIQFQQVYDALKKWDELGGNDLLTGALIVAQYRYPDLSREEVEKHLKQIQQDIWIEINNSLTALEKIKIVNHVLYEVYGFTGNRDNLYDTQNSYINQVIETKKTNPLSISVLYIIIAQNLGMPVYGVNLPSYFALCYLNVFSPKEDDSKQEDKVLFYMDAFNKGTAFSMLEVKTYLEKIKIQPQPDFFQPCSNKVIIKRILADLIYSYRKAEEEDKAKELEYLLTAIT